MEFGDTSLGAPRAGQTYAAETIPGFIFHIKYEGNLYEYHTDKTDKVVFVKKTPVP